ncbi:hypothetical protein C8R43DRAFT_242608 [Mycena crocata]|nr:hypothetical protein C8R43DRAFT_242608 [Mycena crocata]
MPDTQGQPQSPGLLDGTVSSEAVLHESESSPTGIDTQSNDSTQRMIATLRDCFEALQNSNIEQFSSLKTELERLTWVEAQKQPTQSIDTKTSFWTAYKKLADEFDKELKDKYGDDLDNSLIFAGLFSAVTSAFIIQIQPEFQPGPNATTEALLVFLVQNITASAVPANLVVAHNVSTIVVVAQCLLYFSLFCTLFAALLAVLGKQWVMYYHSVDGKGTIAERGLARQRKLDSLERWNFTLIMEISPLLLQLSLLLFATGLSIYLWTINHTIAKILVALASLGFILYILIIVLSLVRRDSPFQTSLTTFLLHILPRSSRFSGTSQNILASFPCSKSLMKLCTRIYGLWKNWTTSMEAIPSILPYFIIGKATEPASTNAAHIFPHIPPPSPETSAIVWVLETSTDLKLVEVAAAVVPDLQWPTSRNLDHCLKRLADAFNGCFDDHYLREGMDSFATSCIHAFGVLHLVNNSHVQPSNVWTLEPDLCYSHGQGSEELTTITIWFQTRNLEIDLHTVITPWAVQFMSDGTLSEEHLPELLGNFNPDEASLRDPSVLADFLFCVNSIFVRPSVQDISLRDKRDYCVELTTAVFENIVKHLTVQALTQSIFPGC